VLSVRLTHFYATGSVVGPIANLKGPYFQTSLSVCVCVSDPSHH